MEKVEIGRATLFCGDCREVLPMLPKVDAVVTDPPYGINGGAGGDAANYRKGDYEKSGWDDTPEYIASVCVSAIEECRKIAVAVALTPGIRCMGLYPPPSDIGCFWTPAACTHGPWGMTTFQPILFYGKDWRAGKGALPSGRQLTERAEQNGHPCPKPIKAWTWLVDKVAPPSSTVLDPFMGSGTTGVACMNTGRNFIGIEKERRYFNIACERIERAQQQCDLFHHPDMQKQEPLF